jgi:ribonuclease D
LRDAAVLAVDTEQDAYFAYRPKICVLQIGAFDEEWIVDAQAIRDFSPLREVFADRSVPKIMHAGENDVGLLRRDCGLAVGGLFDTMAAAGIVGRRRTGLANLLDDLFAVRIEKRYQRSDWRKRPLHREQIEYAALDVRHLPRLRQHMMDELGQLGREEEAASEFARIEGVQWQQRDFDPEDYQRIDGARGIDGVSRRLLRDLFVLRDDLARQEDRAPFRVATDGTLLAIARQRPATHADLQRIHGLSGSVSRRLGERILAAVRDAEEMGPIPLVHRRSNGNGAVRLDDSERRRFDVLRMWRAGRAADRGVEPGRVVPNALLARIVKASPRTREDLVGAGVESWRIREYGDDILEVLRGTG